MLLRFEVSNYRSIMAPVELSMIAVDEGRAATRGFDKLNERVLTVAGIYGPNASGKSNIVDALAWLSRAVATSLQDWDDRIPRETHRFGGGPSNPTHFSLDLMVGGTRYEYQLDVEDTHVVYERLDCFPERRRRMLFERDANMEISFRRGTEAQVAIRELLTPTTLALSAALRYSDPSIGPAATAISGFALQGLRPKLWGKSAVGAQDLVHGSSQTSSLFEAGHSLHQEVLFDEEDPRGEATAESALALLRFADMGIDDVRIVDESDGEGIGTRRRVQLVHRAGAEPVAFELHDESEGTQNWFRLIGPTLDALAVGNVLLFDEIDASLHPRLSARLLELFHDPATNAHGAQLIFTTHDTSLLGSLNRDEVWLTDKSDEGETTLTALAEFGGDQVRRSTNLEKGYLQGSFGAVPELDQARLRHALGPATSTTSSASPERA